MLSFFCFHIQHEKATDATTSLELSVDATSKSATNLALSRTRPVSVPVHKLAADDAFHKLVSNSTLCITFCVMFLNVPS